MLYPTELRGHVCEVNGRELHQCAQVTMGGADFDNVSEV